MNLELNHIVTAGCGGFADNQVGAVSTTGHGEAIMKVTLARLILFHMEQGNTHTHIQYSGYGRVVQLLLVIHRKLVHRTKWCIKLLFLLYSDLRSVSGGCQWSRPGLHEVQSGRSGWGGDCGPSGSLGRSVLQPADGLGCSSERHPALWPVHWRTHHPEHRWPTLTGNTTPIGFIFLD